MQFKISKELLVQIEQLIHQKNDQELEVLLNDLHHADIAEIFEELDIDEATYIFKVFYKNDGLQDIMANNHLVMIWNITEKFGGELVQMKQPGFLKSSMIFILFNLKLDYTRLY